MSLTQKELYAFIVRQRYAVLSTAAADGSPQSALVGVAVTSRLEIVFDTLSSTRKIANLRARPKVSLVIGWQDERSVQMEGWADEPGGEDLARLKACYFSAWPDGRSRQAWTAITYVRVVPTWCRFCDFNRIDDPVRELSLPPSG